jgi:hypothetical protein
VRRGRGKEMDEMANQSDVKFVKTKELQKVLVCNIIGVALNLAGN